MPNEDPLPSLEEFEKKLSRVRKDEKDSEKLPSASGMVLRLGSEFVSGIVVGAGAGILLDRWWDTTPLMLLVCLCFGIAASVRTMMATIKRYEDPK